MFNYERQPQFSHTEEDVKKRFEVSHSLGVILATLSTNATTEVSVGGETLRLAEVADSLLRRFEDGSIFLCIDENKAGVDAKVLRKNVTQYLSQKLIDTVNQDPKNMDEFTRKAEEDPSLAAIDKGLRSMLERARDYVQKGIEMDETEGIEYFGDMICFIVGKDVDWSLSNTQLLKTLVRLYLLDSQYPLGVYRTDFDHVNRVASRTMRKEYRLCRLSKEDDVIYKDSKIGFYASKDV